jgi:hypothetical protein
MSEEYAAITPASSISPETVHWLWPGRLARGKLSLLDGDPGVGKSWLSLAIATTIVAGAPFPGSEQRRDPTRVLIMTAEDGVADTVVPRLNALAADTRRIDILRGVQNGDDTIRHFNLDRNLPALEEALRGRLYGLLIIDPLSAYIPAAINTDKDNQVRSILAPLGLLAEAYGVSILALRHLTKGGRDRALYRGQGSIGFGALARVIMLAGKDRGGRRLLTVVKCSNAEEAPAVGYEIREGRFGWLGLTNGTAQELLLPEVTAENAPAAAEAIEFLREALADEPVAASQLIADAAKAGITKTTLTRARYELGIKAKRHGYASAGIWLWYLPHRIQGFRSDGMARIQEGMDSMAFFKGPSARETDSMEPASAEGLDSMTGGWWDQVVQEGAPGVIPEDSGYLAGL